MNIIPLGPNDGLKGESIGFQENTKLGDGIRDILAELVKTKPESPDQIQDMLISAGLLNFIFDETGIKLSLDVAHSMGLSITMPVMNPNSSIYSGVHKRYGVTKGLDDLEKTGKKTIVVDLKNSYVHNAKDIVSTLSVGVYTIYESTPEKVTAGILHELGHVMGAFYALTNSALGDFALKEFADAVTGQKDDKKKIQLVDRFSENCFKLDTEEIIRAANADEDISTVILDGYLKHNRSVFGSPSFDYSAYERLADDFVVKHGYFVQLAEFLDDNEGIGLGAAIFMQIFAIAFEGGIVGAVIFFANAFSDREDNTYDDPIDRLRSIRISQKAKLKDASKEQRKEIIHALEKVDKIIDGKYDWMSFNKAAARALFHRKSKRAKTTQQLLSHFSTSELRALEKKTSKLLKG